MGRIVSIFLVITFTFVASGWAKAIKTDFGARSVIHLSAVNTVHNTTLEIAECCSKDAEESKSKKPRCLGDNLMVDTFVSIDVPAITDQYVCSEPRFLNSITKKRDNRPPIA